MNLLFFGPPGAGKGTQSCLLVEKRGMKHISTGDLFRYNIKNQTPLGLEAKSYMDKGDLVPDSVTIGMVEQELNGLQGKEFILDGFPRTVPQAQALTELLEKMNISLDKVLFLVVPQEQLMARLTGRRVCSGCGAVFHIQNKPTKVEGVCDECGGQVSQRKDDAEEAILNRLKVYDETTMPVKTYYDELNKVVELDGTKSTEEVFESIKVAIG